jgi:hypothetical protein
MHLELELGGKTALAIADVASGTAEAQEYVRILSRIQNWARAGENYGVYKCNGDLDEGAGATDAIACSYRSYFLRCKSWLLGDNRLAVLLMSFSSIRLLPL